MKRRNRKLLRSQIGTSMVEILVTLGMVTATMGVGVLSLDRDYMDAVTARQSLVNELRRARMMATLKGAHYRVDVDGDGYSIQRLKDAEGTGTWTVDESTPSRRTELPPSVWIEASASSVEFDGRGLLVPDEFGTYTETSLKVADNKGAVRSIQVWPSGQVEALESTVSDGVSSPY